MKKNLLIIIIVLRIQSSFGQTDSLNQKQKVILRFPLIEYPYLSYAAKAVAAPGNPVFSDYLRMYGNPSMAQSLAISNDLYLTAHYGFKQLFRKQKAWKQVLYSTLCAAAADLLLYYSPLGNGWLHEEYHRSIMSLHNINSFNDMNTFPIGAAVVSVNSVHDTQLAKMKLNSNSDFVRLMSAGIEGQYHQVQQMQKDNFYYNQDLPNISLYWASTLNAVIYVNRCAAPSANTLTDELMNKESTNIKKRDFTGLDFDAWTYDLFHPTEVYDTRGIHPSGIGIKRYIKQSDLTVEELNYLKKQGNLQFLNLITASLYGFYRLKIKSTTSGDYFGNFAIRHVLTSFGSDISTTVMFQSPKRNYYFAYHLYQNYTNSFHGIEAEIIDEPIKIKDKTILVTPRAVIWSQPKDQLFKTNELALGGLVSLAVDYPLSKRLFLNMTVSGKTSGWVMGNMYLKSNVSVMTGLNFNLVNNR